MNKAELITKYPDSQEILDSLEQNKVWYFRGNRTIHPFDDKGKDPRYYYNYEGVHIRLFPELESIIKWFCGSSQEKSEVEKLIVEFGYSSYLSKIKNDSEVWLNSEGNVSEDFCDFTNKDFTEKQLAKAKTE